MHEAVAPLRDAAPGIGWVRAERLHVTLKFLGEQPESLVILLRVAVEEIAARHAAMPLALGEVGAFPTMRRPRVIWLGIKPDPRLELLQHDVESACASLGFEIGGKPFRPHVTLGRVRERLDRGHTAALSRAARRIRYRDTVTAQSVDLMESDLSPGGAGYTTLAAARLTA